MYIQKDTMVMTAVSGRDLSCDGLVEGRHAEHNPKALYPVYFFLTMFRRISKKVFSTATSAGGERLNQLVKDQFGFSLLGGVVTLAVAGGWFMLKTFDHKMDFLERKMDSKFELLNKQMTAIRSDLKEISKESNQRILALEVDKGVRERLEEERRRHNRHLHKVQGQDLSQSD